MPYNGSGVFTPDAADFPAVTGTIIDADKFNNVINDIASGLSTAITKDGQTTPTQNIPFNGKRLTGVGAGVTAGDAINYTQLTADSGSSLVGFLQAGSNAVARTAQAKMREITSVSDYDTFQHAIDSAISRGAWLYIDTSASSSTVTLTNAVGLTVCGGGDGTVLTVTGDMSGASADTTRTALFNLAGTCSDVHLRDFKILGDGVEANQQRGIGYVYASPPTLSRIHVTNVTFKNLLIAAVLPGPQEAHFLNCHVYDSVGSASGKGIGFVCELGAASARTTDFKVTACHFYRTMRHAIYINKCDGYAITGCTFREHQTGFVSASSDGKVAMALSRSTGGSVTGNVFTSCSNGSISVDTDGTGGTDHLRGCNITGNTFYNGRGCEFRVGKANSGVTDDVTDVNFVGNTIVTNANYAAANIIVNDVKNLRITNNVIDADRAYAATHIIMDISEYTASYFSGLYIENNTGAVSSAGNSYFVNLSAGLSASSGGVIKLLNNDIIGATRQYLYNAGSVAGACTNSKIVTDWTFENDITTGTTPSIAGYNRFNLSYAGATNITNFTNGYDGKDIDLYFSDANVTLTNAMYLAGAVNFTGSANDTMTLRYRGASTNWFERSRSVN